MKIRPIVAGNTTINAPASKLYMKLANEGVIKYVVLRSHLKFLYSNSSYLVAR
jgi:hypothetical protein